MSSKKDVRALIDEHVQYGFRVELSRGLHYKVLDPAGRMVAVFPGTPSDGRGIKNARATLHRLVRECELAAA